VPRVFEPELCLALIRYYDERGGEESGFVRDVGGKTVTVLDHQYKRRRDQDITDQALQRACMVRIHDRLAPEIFKAYQFRATRIERYIVSCYDASTGGYFLPHRDNTTRGTAHRRFAVSLNLNTGEYEGGLLHFPEFGGLLYQPPAGGAVVFSCSLLHQATPVTRGKRYAFLPFLYDDAAAKVRDENLKYVELNPQPQPPAG
jgi:predicted 2-oxoglutarate/Fe(II)-dependent dioxygenase YbiX